jgi:hypothetical protein
MASEQRGLFYEAMTFYALSSLGRGLGNKNQAFWNETPQLMTIDTDITIGPFPNAPKHLFLVSHCTAEHNSDMKFWRNIGEVGEAHSVFDPPPRTICVLYDAKFKRNLLILQPYAFDDYVDVTKYAWGRVLIDFAHAHHGSLPVEKESKLRFLKKNQASNAALRSALGSLAKRLAESLKTRSKNAEMLWRAVKAVEMSRVPGAVPTQRLTSLRRGLAKMLFFEKLPTLAQRADELSKSLRLTTPSIRGTLLSDRDVSNALRDFDRKLLEALHGTYRSKPEFLILVEPLRAIDASFTTFWNYLVCNWSEFLTGPGLYKHLIKSHEQPKKVLGLPSRGLYLPPGWLLLMMFTLLKAAVNKRMEFGYSKIVNAVEALTRERRIKAAKGVFSAAEIGSARSSRTIEYGMRDWIYGDVRQNFTLLPQELFLIAEVLSEMLRSTIGSELDPSLEARLKEFFVDDTIETKLVAHPAFRPLKDLLVLTVKKHGLSFRDVPYYPSPLWALADRDGKKLNVRAASTNVLIVRKTLIRWISATDEGRKHKCKEFCGRAWGLRLKVNPATGAVDTRCDIKKTILLVDGTFDQKELHALSRAGWDEIVYPDEMERLIKSIV